LNWAREGVPVSEEIRKTGIREQTFYGWKPKYAGTEVEHICKMEQFTDLHSLLNENDRPVTRIRFPVSDKINANSQEGLANGPADLGS